MLKSIIIPVFNQSHYTKQCLTDLFHLDSTNEIILVNNRSVDDTTSVINKIIKTKHDCKFTLINVDSNLGFAKACNIGYENSIGEIVIFLNNDIRVSGNSLFDWTNEIEYNLKCEEDPNILISPNGGYLDKNYNFKYETGGIQEWNYLSGWLLYGYRNTFNKFCKELNQSGPFIEEFTTYFEDTYMSFQAKKLGIKLKIIKAPIQHIGRGTSNKMNLQDIYFSAKQKFIKKVKEL